MSELPQGWASVTIADIARDNYGKNPADKDRES